jgi:predicted MPP superfamily phosphohydrolase
MATRRQLGLTRRRFLAGAGGLAFGLGAYGYARLVELHWIEVTYQDLPLPHLPQNLVGRTLVQLSDLHVGPIVDPDYLKAAVALVLSLQPDLVVLTGDVIHCDGRAYIDQAARILETLPTPPLGCFAALGNHDYGPGWSRREVAEQLSGRLTGLGIHVLRNTCQLVAGLQLVGLDDLWGPCFRPQEVLPRLDPGRPSLVLCHNPDAVDLPVWSGYRGWVLAGHTHGGQCKPPFLPPPVLPVKNRRYTAGVFELSEGRWLYINRGLGYLRRVRFNVRPEIAVFQLQRA